MSECGRALEGRRIVVTRPLAQSGGLCRAIGTQGGEAFCFPLIEIADPEDWSAFDAALPHLDEYDLAFFVSPNAVEKALTRILATRSWPAGLPVSTVGKGSEQALARVGFDGVIAPTQGFDSEAVLALAEFAAGKVSGRKILILRGDGGRDLLGDTLRERGARVDYLACYRRFCPHADLSALRDARPDAMILTSSEGVRNLAGRMQAEDREAWADLPVFAPHARIAAEAALAGFSRVTTTPAGDEGVLAALVAHFDRSAGGPLG